MSNGAQMYVKDVAALLECPTAKKKEVMAFVEDSIAEHGLEEANYNVIADTLGEPQQVAHMYAECTSPIDRQAVRRHKKFVRTAIAAVAIIVAVLAIWLATLATMNYIERRAFRNGYFVETIYDGDYPHDTNAIDETTVGASK